MCDIKITFWVSEMSIVKIMEGVKGNSTNLGTFLQMRGQFIIHLINYTFSGQNSNYCRQDHFYNNQLRYCCINTDFSTTTY